MAVVELAALLQHDRCPLLQKRRPELLVDVLMPLLKKGLQQGIDELRRCALSHKAQAGLELGHHGAERALARRKRIRHITPPRRAQ